MEPNHKTVDREILEYTDAKVEAFFKLYLDRSYSAQEVRKLVAELEIAVRLLQQYPWILADPQNRTKAQELIDLAKAGQERVHDCTRTLAGKERAAGK
jgi:hypothetical protein